jgi:hypothetical protein
MNAMATDNNTILMQENDFWNIIEQSLVAAPHKYEEQITALKMILLTLDPVDIVLFDNRFTDLLALSYDYKLWGAAHIINHGCSDDCFYCFRQYLIAQGKDKFYQSLANPDTCTDWIKTEEQENWEGLQYAAFEAYKQRTGVDIPQQYNPSFELKGKPFVLGNLASQYPRLMERFGK